MLSIPDSADWDFGSGDFTIDLWLRVNANSSGAVVGKRADGTAEGPFLIFDNNGTLNAYLSSTGSSWDLLSAGSFGTLATGVWYHIALVREGTTAFLFRDGTLINSYSIGSAPLVTNTQPVRVGGESAAYFLNGWIDELRVSKGIARWTSAFAPPAQAYTTDTGAYLDGSRSQDVFKLKQADGGASCWTATCTANWAYNGRDQLVSADTGTGSTATPYTLDAIGNATAEGTTSRTYAGQKLTSQTAGGTTSQYMYDALGNVDCVVTGSWSAFNCPAAGDTNLLEDYSYDYKNRLTTYVKYTSGSATATESWSYDALDRPVSQTQTSGGSTTTTAYRYLADTNALTRETLSGGTNTTRKYSYDALGNRISFSDGANRFSYLYDPHGSVSLLLDQTSAVKASYGYSAYGSANPAISKTASGFTDTNPYRYEAKRLDPGSNSYDMGARRYNVATGRWLQQDLYYGAFDNLALAQDPLNANRYLFTGANPINYIEVDGHRLDEGAGSNGGTGGGSGAFTHPCAGGTGSWITSTSECPAPIQAQPSGGNGGGHGGRGPTTAGPSGPSTASDFKEPPFSLVDPGTQFHLANGLICTAGYTSACHPGLIGGLMVQVTCIKSGKCAFNWYFVFSPAVSVLGGFVTRASGRYTVVTPKGNMRRVLDFNYQRGPEKAFRPSEGFVMHSRSPKSGDYSYATRAGPRRSSFAKGDTVKLSLGGYTNAGGTFQILNLAFVLRP